MKKIILVMVGCLAFIAASAQTRTHVVQRGETIESIAKKYGITVDELKKSNQNAGSLFFTGLKLNIPNAKPVQNDVKASQNTDNGFSERPLNTPYPSNPISPTTKSKPVPNDFSFYSANYTTIFKAVDAGIAGFAGHIYGFGKSYFGLSFSLGWQFKGIASGGGGVRFGLGPNFCYPLSEHTFVYAPLCADLNGVMDNDDNWNFSFGVEFLPSIGYKYKKFVFAGGLSFMWQEGADALYPGFNVSIGYDL